MQGNSGGEQEKENLVSGLTKTITLAEGKLENVDFNIELAVKS